MLFVYRRSVIKDAIGKVRSYLSKRKSWEQSGKKKGNLAYPAPPIIPRSIRAPSPWIWKPSMRKTVLRN